MSLLALLSVLTLLPIFMGDTLQVVAPLPLTPAPNP